MSVHASLLSRSDREGGQGEREGRYYFKNTPRPVSPIQDRTLFFRLLHQIFLFTTHWLSAEDQPGLSLGLVLDCTLGSGDVQPGPKTHHQEDTWAAAKIPVNTARGSNLGGPDQRTHGSIPRSSDGAIWFYVFAMTKCWVWAESGAAALSTMAFPALWQSVTGKWACSRTGTFWERYTMSRTRQLAVNTAENWLRNTCAKTRSSGKQQEKGSQMWSTSLTAWLCHSGGQTWVRSALSWKTHTETETGAVSSCTCGFFRSQLDDVCYINIIAPWLWTYFVHHRLEMVWWCHHTKVAKLMLRNKQTWSLQELTGKSLPPRLSPLPAGSSVREEKGVRT